MKSPGSKRIQGTGEKIGSEDGGTHCGFSLVLGVFASVDETGDGSEVSVQLLHVTDTSALLCHLGEKDRCCVIF